IPPAASGHRSALAAEIPRQRRRAQHAGVPEGVLLQGGSADGDGQRLPGLVRVCIGGACLPTPACGRVLSPPDPYLTVSVAALEAMPFGFTTCTVQVRAVPPTFTVAWIWLADADWMAAPCSVSEAPAVVSTTCSPLPGWKPEPLMVSVCAAAERVMGFGLSEAMAGGATTWKLPLLEASPLGLTTCTVQVRAVAPTSISARICVLLTKAICPPLKVDRKSTRLNSSHLVIS